MDKKKADSLLETFKTVFKSIDPSKSNYTKWSDFIFMSAAAFRNSVKDLSLSRRFYSQEVEDEYLKRITTYNKTDQSKISRLFGLFVEIAEYSNPTDILGSLYMELGLGETNKGQFFTPDPISYLAATVHSSHLIDTVNKQGYFMCSDPACGAGSTLLGLVRTCIDNDINPQETLLLEGRDIDRNAALMCYVQLSVFGISARIVIGDTLANECKELWYTPFYAIKKPLFNAKHRAYRKRIKEAKNAKSKSKSNKHW